MRSAPVVTVLLCTRIAFAQAQGEPSSTPAPAPAQAATDAAALFAEGRALLADGKAAAACDKFSASLSLNPTALGPILNLGACNEVQDKLATALRWYQRAQTRAAELDVDASALAAKAKLVALAARVPTIRVSFMHAPPQGTEVLLDGERVDDVDFARIELDAGHHVLDAVFAGDRHVRREIDVTDGGAVHEVVVDGAKAVLDPAKLAVETERARELAEARHEHERVRARRRVAEVIGAAGAALLVGDGVLSLVAKHTFDTTDSPYTQQDWRTAMRYGGTSMFALGLAGVGVGVWLYFTPPRRERAPVAIAPVVAPDTIGVSARGGF